MDLIRESDRLMAIFQRKAVVLAATGSLAILALLFAGLRSVRRVASVAAPLVTAVAVTAALLTLEGGKLSIFMVTGFLLTVAVGSNYCLFFERSAPAQQHGVRGLDRAVDLVPWRPMADVLSGIRCCTISA